AAIEPCGLRPRMRQTRPGFAPLLAASGAASGSRRLRPSAAASGALPSSRPPVLPCSSSRRCLCARAVSPMMVEPPATVSPADGAPWRIGRSVAVPGGTARRISGRRAAASETAQSRPLPCLLLGSRRRGGLAAALGPALVLLGGGRTFLGRALNRRSGRGYHGRRDDGGGVGIRARPAEVIGAPVRRI